MNFRVGQKVVCVRDQWGAMPDGYLPPALPQSGCEYVIRTLEDSPHALPGVAIRLCELKNPPRLILDPCPRYIPEPSFATIGLDHHYNFRPVIERKTDISIFQRMLTPTDKVKA